MRRYDHPELLDQPDLPEEELRGSLLDIQKVNRYLLGKWVILHHLKRLRETMPQKDSLTILDIGTGSADIPQAIMKWGKGMMTQMRVIGLDFHAKVITFAREEVKQSQSIIFVRGDALALPFANQSVDVATAALLLHHRPEERVIDFLREIDRVTRFGFIVNDLIRSPIAYGVIWMLTRLFTRNRLTRHDGPLSVLRAYTPREYQEMIGKTALQGLHLYTYPFYRVALVRKKQ